MRELAAIKVSIGLKTTPGTASGQHKYPDFGTIEVVRRSGLNWSRYVDVYGTGWHYCRKSGHADNDPEIGSPVGHQHGMLLVPKEFADEAASVFTGVEKMTDAEAKSFYEARCMIGAVETIESAEVLQTIAAKRQLGIEETEQDRRALDPDDPTPGIVRNERATWTGFKKAAKIKIIA